MLKKAVSLLFLFLALQVSAQRNTGGFAVDTDTLGTYDRTLAPDARFIGLETGIGRSTYRDMATSPLFYNGFPVNFKLSFLREGAGSERSFYLQYAFGTYRSDGNYVNASRVNSFFTDYSKLYRIPAWTMNKWKTTIGGKVNLTANVRNNPSLQNNAYGVEFLANVMGSIQVERSLSRLQPNPRKFFFIRYGRKVKVRSVTSRFNAGLLNTNYKNGFIFTQQYNVVDKVDVFENYRFRVNGLRFGSTIAFTREFPRGNAIRWSYNWDAYRTSYAFEGFDMAHHTLTFALLFRTR